METKIVCTMGRGGVEWHNEYGAATLADPKRHARIRGRCATSCGKNTVEESHDRSDFGGKYL